MECSCFSALTLVDDSCTKFDDVETKAKAAKKKCTKPSDEPGSFGDCRKQERLVAHYGYKCKDCSTSVSTKVCYISRLGIYGGTVTSNKTLVDGTVP